MIFRKYYINSIILLSKEQAKTILAQRVITFYNSYMDDFDGIILFAVGALVCVLLYLGFTTIVKKTFKTIPEQDSSAITLIEKEQDEKVDDVRARQKRLMEAQKQRIRDLQRL